MKFYNPTTGVVVSSGSIYAQFGILPTVENASKLGYYELLDAPAWATSGLYANFFTTNNIVPVGEDKYRYIVEPSEALSTYLGGRAQQSGVNARSQAIANWIITQVAAWSNSTTYTTGQYVKHDEDSETYIWTAVQGNTNSEPTSSNTANWTRTEISLPT